MDYESLLGHGTFQVSTPRPPPCILLELTRNGEIFLPSLEKMTFSGGKPQESKDDKSAWLRLSSLVSC